MIDIVVESPTLRLGFDRELESYAIYVKTEDKFGNWYWTLSDSLNRPFADTIISLFRHGKVK